MPRNGAIASVLLAASSEKITTIEAQSIERYVSLRLAAADTRL